MILMHTFPFIMDIKELCVSRTEYESNDYLWTLFFYVCYGVIYVIDMNIREMPMSSILTFKDMKTIITIAITTIITLIVHYGGYYCYSKKTEAPKTKSQ